MLERDDVRSALTARDFGTVFRLARKWGGISYNQIAEACGIKPERVGTIARGDARITSLAKIEEIADALRILGGMIGLAPRPWESPSTSSMAAPALRPPATSGMLTPEPALWEVAELARRTHATDVGPADLDTIAEAIDQLCRAYPYMAADQLHHQTRAGIRHVTDMLQGRTTLAQHRELLVSAGWLFLLGGCLEYDMGQRQAAELSRAAALRIGQEAGHGEITAWSWELGAWFALTQGRYADVIDCVSAGHQSDSTHSIGVQLYAQGAKAYARMGDASQVRATLDAGRARLERLPRPEHREHHFVIDPDKWDFYEMDAYRMLGDDERAAVHAQEVVRLGTAPDGTEISPMRVAEARLTLGVAAARSGELEEAVSVAGRALQTSRKSLPSLLMVAGELTDELEQRYPRESLSQEFREQVTHIAAGAQTALGS
ncbi:helix-turn-helix transcriptional regulator [Streptomyces sp. ME19-01-6]|uniref:helix-turn-helix domain-containing protein n=1 Tax=Streptomyces sp. ME19-01-6 TaxID=3028686 RepID=UPI0029A38E8B|nr:helix-turn-helix transcriptional regulator [Streptomyces sp. ME19-01-6]MDX3231264.1 helix-turn-helix transcriptional regulator [Streptomyces sp. ME19-01-6]